MRRLQKPGATVMLLLLVGLMLSATKSHRAAASGPWYVAPGGSDNSSCLSQSAPCATINAAIAKAMPGDTVYIAVGTYTGTGASVVYVDREVTLSGGWDQNFSTQHGLTTLDGQDIRTGLVVFGKVTAEFFNIQNGQASNYAAGGIDTRDVLTLRASIVSGNANGGIYNTGILTIISSTVTANINVFSPGGGIHNEAPGSLSIVDSVVSNNIGPVDFPYANLDSSLLGGGGIYNSSFITLTRTTVSHNASCGAGCGGAGIYNTGSLTVIDSAVTHNRNSHRGGGIYSNGILDLTNSSITHNLGEEGAGLWARDWTNTRLRNVSIAYNAARRAGGGIWIDAMSQEPSLFTLANTLVAANTAAGNLADCSGRVHSDGYNLIGAVNGCVVTPTVGDLMDVAPALLSPSGPFPVVALSEGSQAIDSGDPDGCRDAAGVLILHDQRGSPRPIDGDGDGADQCDIGAFEFNPIDQFSHVYVPLVRRALGCSAGICGQILRNGLGVPGRTLFLRYYNGSAWSTRAITASGADGHFGFVGVPGLAPGERYYVLYLNDTEYDLLWATRELSQYVPGSAVEIGVFDVAFVRVVEPYYTNVSLSLPYTFWWQARAATPGDSYGVDLYDPADGSPYYSSPLLGYRSDHTLHGLPPGFQTNTFYAMDMWVYSPDGGFGTSSGRIVRFTNTGQTAATEGAELFDHEISYPHHAANSVDLRWTDPLLADH